MPTYTGTSGADVFTAPDDQDWTIIGKSGADVLTGGGGNDTFLAGQGNDILNGGGGNDTFLVDLNGGTDSYDGGDSAYEGADGFDIIKANVDNAIIGISTITGIEEISSNGHVNVRILGNSADNFFDFTNVTLTGIAHVGGGAGNDTIYGNATTATVIDGGSGNDTLRGGAGDDTFLIGTNAGTDTIDGGAGFDTVLANANNAVINWGAFTSIEAIDGNGFSNVTLNGTSGDDYLYLPQYQISGIAAIHAGDGNDTVIGTADDDVLWGDDGDDIIRGGQGSDTLYGGTGVNILDGGAGDDTLYVSGKGSKYTGGSGYDVIYAGAFGQILYLDKGTLKGVEEISANGFGGFKIAGANPDGSMMDLRHVIITEGDIISINGGIGDDTIYGSAVADTINGGSGNDLINGANGDDIIDGGSGADTLLGGAGSDTITGGAGSDVITGGAGSDFLFGGDGNDVFMVVAGDGADEYHGDKGIDTIQASKGVNAVVITAIDGIEAINSNGVQNLFIRGTAADDTLDFTGVTFTGVAAIQSGDGNDTVIGTAGNDTITGGAGLDTLTGGAGADIFTDKAAGLNGDHITDFVVGDKIIVTDAKDWTKVSLSYLDDGTGTAGTLHLTGVQGLKAGIDIHLDGAFTTGSFIVESDGGTGAVVHLVGGVPLI